MNPLRSLVALCSILCCPPMTHSLAQNSIAATRPPRIDSVVPLKIQPHASDPAVIWFDDFDDEKRQRTYPEQSGQIVADERFGNSGRSLEMFYPQGGQGTGGRKLFFGDSPAYSGQVVRKGEIFDDIYWRIYVKHPADWRGGGPAKLSRATSLVSPGWNQAMIAHVWSSGDALTLDPATGVTGNRVVTTRYNDFANLRWLGNRPASQFRLHGAEGVGWWVCVEARARLNTPGQKDGINQLWIDGRLEAERTQLDWRGEFADRGINAVFLEAYWNDGSPVDQSRWIDSFVVSTAPIGPVVCPRNPVLLRTLPPAGEQIGGWQVEVAADAAGQHVVWQSSVLTSPRAATVDDQHGQFTGMLEGESMLSPSTEYYSRVRQQSPDGNWGNWSPWHQPFRTTSADAT